MNYIGKLYGKIGGECFDTGKTSEDWDKLVIDANSDYLRKENEKLEARLKIAMAALMDLEFTEKDSHKIANKALNEISKVK